MYGPRYAGARWHLRYGAYAGVAQCAVNEAQRAVQSLLPYVLDVQPAEAPAPESEHHLIVVGTPSDNPIVARLVEQRWLSVPTQPESFTLACADAPWSSTQRLLAIAGADAKGVLNGVHDLQARVLATRVTPDGPGTAREAFDALPDFTISEAPAIQQRGIWSWGYVIYDYRRYLDHMALLKMNLLVVWNDYPPINLPQILEYAHARGIRVIVGFPWGWGECELKDLLDPTQRAQLKATILQHYREHYRHLAIDGIYFQTCTEHNDKFLDGRSTASITCEWVNEVARAMLEEQPELAIFFGLHATSIGERYVDYVALDPRVTIMWEDVGVLPYDYIVLMEQPGSERGTFDETLTYSEQLVRFHPENAHFAMVPKGWMHLRWDRDFEHHSSFVLGERSLEFIRRRLEERQPVWDSRNHLWFERYPYAARFYREILACEPAAMTVAGLVEDGLFEAHIQPSVALFAETIWNPWQTDCEILQRAMSPYYARTE